MKRILAMSLCLLVVLLGLTACKAKLKNGELLTDPAGKEFAAVTDAEGGIKRDEAGNLIVLVTDKNGKNEKDDNGEYATEAVGLEHALVVGNRIEMPDYALTIPSGWSNNESFNELVISRDSNNDTIAINTKRNADIVEIMQNSITPLNQIRGAYESTIYTNKTVQVKDADAQLISIYVPDTTTFWGYIFFEHNSTVYSCMLTAKNDMGSSMDEVLKILNTIEFVN